MAKSQFPEQIDQFRRIQDLPQSQGDNVKRFRELKSKKNLTSAEEMELKSLIQILYPYSITVDDWNHVVDAIETEQKFLKQEIDGYVKDKQVEVQEFINGRVLLINNTVSEGINIMSNKKDYFVTFVNTKEDEIRALVQEFDSNTARYYTTWIAEQDGQVDFNIFQGSNKYLPPEANLNISVENIDLVINGTMQTPYKDYVVHNNGFYDTIRLTSNAQSLIKAGTEIVARWYKNVGKLYFRHAESHGEGARDQITVTLGMLDSYLKDEVKNIPHIGNLPPNPKHKRLWLDTSI